MRSHKRCLSSTNNFFVLKLFTLYQPVKQPRDHIHSGFRSQILQCPPLFLKPIFSDVVSNSLYLLSLYSEIVFLLNRQLILFGNHAYVVNLRSKQHQNHQSHCLSTLDYVFNVVPKALPAVPRVKEIVNGRYYRREKHKSQLKVGKSVHFFEKLLPVL